MAKITVNEKRISQLSGKIEFIDTHCHIHDSEFALRSNKSQDKIIEDAKKAGVKRFVCVGTDAKSSAEAVSFAKNHQECYATLAIHPHEVAEIELEVLFEQVRGFETLLTEKGSNKIIAVGECGLDYYYHQAEEVIENQKKLFRCHIELALKYQLPIIFHIRDAFDDFFKIVDEYKGVSGVVHSFSAGPKELEGCISRGLYIGLNGIMTFSKQTDQLEAARMVPLKKLVLETDAPFLTPAPFRGKMCEPKHLRVTAEFLCELRSESLEKLAQTTTMNARTLFGI